jgi:hypothetical protein
MRFGDFLKNLVFWGPILVFFSGSLVLWAQKKLATLGFCSNLQSRFLRLFSRCVQTFARIFGWFLFLEFETWKSTLLGILWSCGLPSGECGTPRLGLVRFSLFDWAFEFPGQFFKRRLGASRGQFFKAKLAPTEMFVPTHELAPTEVYVMKLASGEVGAYAAPRRQLSRAPSPRLESCPPRRQLSYAHRWLGANFFCRLENPEKLPWDTLGAKLAP